MGCSWPASYCYGSCLSTLPLLDIPPLANGVWTTVNDPDGLQLPGKTDAHSSFGVTLPGHDMIFMVYASGCEFLCRKQRERIHREDMR